MRLIFFFCLGIISGSWAADGQDQAATISKPVPDPHIGLQVIFHHDVPVTDED